MYALVVGPGMDLVLMIEFINYAILCGISWLKSYLQTLSEEKLRIEEKESETTLKFGDSIMFKSMMVKFPVNITGDRANIKHFSMTGMSCHMDRRG